MFAHLNLDSSDFGDVSALHSPFLHQLTMQSSLFEPGCPALVVVCVACKPALVQATVGVGTVLIWDLGVAYTRGGGYFARLWTGLGGMPLLFFLASDPRECAKTYCMGCTTQPACISLRQTFSCVHCTPTPSSSHAPGVQLGRLRWSWSLTRSVKKWPGSRHFASDAPHVRLCTRSQAGIRPALSDECHALQPGSSGCSSLSLALGERMMCCDPGCTFYS